MNQRQALMVYAYLGHLSEMRRVVQWYGHGGMKPAKAPMHSPHVAREALRDASTNTGMTQDELDATLDDFDRATFRRAFRLDGSASVAELLVDAADIARRVTATSPTGNPADFLGAIPEGPDAPGDARDL